MRMLRPLGKPSHLRLIAGTDMAKPPRMPDVSPRLQDMLDNPLTPAEVSDRLALLNLMAVMSGDHRRQS